MSDQPKGVYTAKNLTEEIWELYSGKTQKQYHCCFNDLHKYFKIIKPSFNIVTGTPNCGKSSLVYDIAMRTARNENFKWCIFSPEHSLAVNLKRLCEKYLHKPFDSIFENRANENEIIEAIEFIDKHFYLLDSKGDSPDIDWILDRCKYCVDVFGIDAFIIDPYNEINPNRANLREDEHISLLISKIKRFNRETNTVSFMVAHPNKQIRGADGMFRVNSLYDISGTAHWNNKADTGIIVTRDYEKQVTEVRVAKVREVDIQGNVGSCTLAWNNSTKTFEDTGYE